MAYERDKYIFDNSIEYEYKYKGRYGAPGDLSLSYAMSACPRFRWS